VPVPSLPVPDLPVPLDQPLRGLVLFTGHACVLSLSQLLCLQYLSRSEPVVLVDAANAFDPLLISDAARARRWNLREMLDAVHLSRVYTCHQLEALFTEHLQQAVNAFRPRAVLCLGLLDPLHDEDVSVAEAARIFRRLRTALLALSRRLPILAACPDPAAPAGGTFEARRTFCAGLRPLARWSFTARPETGGVLIAREWPDPARWEWSGGLIVRPKGLALRRR
jgi:hypothetical protein